MDKPKALEEGLEFLNGISLIHQFSVDAKRNHGADISYEYYGELDGIGTPYIIISVSVSSRAIEREYNFKMGLDDLMTKKTTTITHDSLAASFFGKRFAKRTVVYGQPKPQKILDCMKHSLDDMVGYMERYFLRREKALLSDMSLLGLEVYKMFEDDGDKVKLTVYIEAKNKKRDHEKFVLDKKHLQKDYMLVYHCIVEACNRFRERHMPNVCSQKNQQKYANTPSIYPYRVIERNEKIGNERGIMDKDLEMRMIREECEETCQAIESDDKKEVIDGCIDLIFVLFGTLHKTGLSPKHIVDAYNAVCDSNNSKTGERFANGKIKKGKKFVKPDFSKILKEIGSSVK